MRDSFTKVTNYEFEMFLSAYPTTLERSTVMFCDPPVTQFHDFALGEYPDSVVAQHTYGYRDNAPEGFEVRKMP